MPSSGATLQDIRSITQALIAVGLADEFNFPSSREIGHGIRELSVTGGRVGGLGYGNVPYSSIYEEVYASRAFNVRLPDGALLLMQYRFNADTIIEHRLIYWASPDLEASQNEPELYEANEIYLDFLTPSIVPFPIRFDYTQDVGIVSPIDHPCSHLTLGLYKNCRIPVCSPVSPSYFAQFILRNFYNTAQRKFSGELNYVDDLFEESLFDAERRIPHLVLASR